MAYGFHEWTIEHFGFGARSVALVDNMAEEPFLKFSFFMLCTVATWFALLTSVMSLAYVSGGRF